jgi:hypothetical protein
MQAPGCTCHPARSTPDESGVGLPAGAWKPSHNLCRRLARPWAPTDPTLDLRHRTRDSNVTAGTPGAAEHCPGRSFPVRADVATNARRELTTGSLDNPGSPLQRSDDLSPQRLVSYRLDTTASLSVSREGRRLVSAGAFDRHPSEAGSARRCRLRADPSSTSPPRIGSRRSDRRRGFDLET